MDFNEFPPFRSQLAGSAIFPSISAAEAAQLGVEIYGELLTFLCGAGAAFAQYWRLMLLL